MRYLPNQAGRLGRGQRGITGLETAIVLIAFVVMSSVFAFAALSTGLFSADKSKETINAGLSEARSTLEVRGSIYTKSLVVTGETIVTGTGVTTGGINNVPVLSGSETITHSSSGDLTKAASSPTGTQYSIDYDTGVVTVAALEAGHTVTGDYTVQIVDEIIVQVGFAPEVAVEPKVATLNQKSPG